MTIEQLNTIIQAEDVDKLIGTIETHKIVKDIELALKQYDPKQHKVLVDKTEAGRPDKSIKDSAGNLVKTINVARLPLSLQKKITLVSAAFLGTPRMDSKPADEIQENFFTIIDKVWQDNKLDYKFKKIAKTVMSEKECAEIWFMQEAEQANQQAGIVGYWQDFPINQQAKFKLGIKLLSNSMGDTLYPLFDEFGDMIAFGRAYKILDIDGKEVKHFDVYTADQFYFYTQTQQGWLGEVKPNIIRKIPIIYYWQPITEWDDVQILIDRLETKISNHADTNDYFDRPMLVGKGDSISLPEKGESGKYVELKGQYSELKYLTWDQAPESMKMEIEGLKNWINYLTSTPDISFENLKSLGYFSTIALQTIFMDAHLKASDKEEIFGEGLQRRINYLKKAISVIDPAFVKALPLQIKPKFEYFLPKNVGEIIDTLIKCVNAGIMTPDTAVRQNPQISDPDAEIEALKQLEIEKEKKEKARLALTKPTNGLPV